MLAYFSNITSSELHDSYIIIRVYILDDTNIPLFLTYYFPSHAEKIFEKE